MSYRHWEAKDPLEVLIRKGEDCSHCQHLGKYRVVDQLVTICENKQAPEKLRKAAPARRCDQWKHEKQDGGQ